MTKKKKMLLVALAIILIVGIGLLVWGLVSGKIKTKADTSGSISGNVFAVAGCEQPKAVSLYMGSQFVGYQALVKSYFMNQPMSSSDYLYTFNFNNLFSGGRYNIKPDKLQCANPGVPGNTETWNAGLVSPQAKGLYALCSYNNTTLIPNPTADISIVVLPKKGFLWGKVTGKSGSLIIGAVIKLSNGGGVSTNSKGYYQIQANTGENIGVTVNAGMAGGYAPATSTVTITGCQGTRKDFTLLESGSTTTPLGR